jgi:tetratricopeptide (TPR) repeat protein
MGNYGAAIQIYKSVFSVLNKHLGSDPDNPDYQSMIGVLYTQLGIAYHLAGEYESSKEAFEKSIPLKAKLLDEKPENVLHMGDMAVAFTEYSKLLTSMGMKKEAEKYAAKADEIKEKIMKKFRFDESTIADEDKKAL